jgi:hypothetical protein
MKKNLKLLGILGLVLVFALVMAGCGDKDTTLPETTLTPIDNLDGDGYYGFINFSSSDVTVTVTSGAGNAIESNDSTNAKEFTLKSDDDRAFFTNGGTKVTFTAKSKGAVKVSINGYWATFADK